MNPTTNTTAKHLVISLGLDASGQQDVRLRANLPPDDLELVALEASPTLSMTHNSHLQMDVGFPLTTAISPTQMAVLESTGISLTVAMLDSGRDITATISGLELGLGSAAMITGTHSLSTITGTHSSPISTTTNHPDRYQ